MYIPICLAIVVAVALTRHLAGPGWSYALAAALSLAALGYAIALERRAAPPGDRP